MKTEILSNYAIYFIYAVYGIAILAMCSAVILRLRYKQHRQWLAIIITTLVMANAYYEYDLYRGGLILCKSWKYVAFAAIYFSGFSIRILWERHQIKKRLIEKGTWSKLAFEWYRLFDVPLGEDLYVDKLQAWTRKIHQSKDRIIFLTKVEGNTERCPYESDFDKLFVFERGECTVEVRGQSKTYYKGDELIIYRHEIHNFTTQKGCWIKVIVIKPDEID